MVTKYQCTIFSVFPKAANSVWAILQDSSELNNKLPTELDDKFLKNVETATEEIQNQLNVDTIGLISSINPQKDKSREEKTRNMFYKNIHQTEIDNVSLTPKMLKDLVRKLSLI